jgi:hypothetical protein
MRIYLSKVDIDRVCGEGGLQRFRGAYTGRCPFLEEPLLSEFSTLGINANADAVLQGIYSLTGSVPKWMTVYMNALRMPLEVERQGLIPDRLKTSEHQHTGDTHWNQNCWNHEDPILMGNSKQEQPPL